jgi:hypothetical protein
MTFESELQAALDEPGRLEALALIHLNTDQMLFLKTTPDNPPEVRTDLEKFLLNAITNTESLDEMHEGDDVVYYDPEDHAIVLTLFKTKKARYLLCAIVAPHKTYKQVLKRLIKSLKTVL